VVVISIVVHCGEGDLHAQHRLKIEGEKGLRGGSNTDMFKKRVN
jgi:hypothetical protein